MAVAGRGPSVWGGASGRGPGPELAGVEYRPDAGDLLACDLERVDRHGDAVLLGHQAGLAVDCALQQRHAGYQAGDSEAGARDLLGALDPAGQAGIVRAFKKAWEARDIGALIGLLDPGATMTADGGGLAIAALSPVEGGEQVARYLADLATRAAGLTILERSVNGQPGLIVQEHGRTVTVFAFEVAADRITRIWAIRNPDKLRPWTAR